VYDAIQENHRVTRNKTFVNSTPRENHYICTPTEFTMTLCFRNELNLTLGNGNMKGMIRDCH
jgi:hypothetical protein